MLNDKDGYILQSGFTENVSSEIRAAFLKLKEQGMQRLILDLRGNVGGLMSEAINIVSLFVPKGSLVVSSKGKAEDTKEYRTTTEPIDTEIPIIVMIDSNSASSSEIVTGALQDLDRATVMGRRSFGKGLVQSIRPVAYNGQLKVTTAKYYTPSGRCVQAIDYSHRNEDGSVGQIPDSLTHEFKTAKGRIVRDGGGITPDIELAAPNYSRLVYSLVLYGVIDRYALEFVKTHDSIPAVDEFHLSDLGKIFSSKMFWIVALLCVLYYSAIFPFQRYAPNYLEITLGVSAETASRLFSCFPILAMVLTPFLGAFLDFKGKGASMLMLGAIIMIVCHLSFAFLLPAFPSKALALVLIVTLGVSFSLVPAALWPSVPKIIDEKILGSAYCLIFWVQNIGLCLVPLLIGATLQATGGYMVPMIIFSTFGVLAFILSFMLKFEDRKKGYGLELPNVKE